jgi:predicted membrane-bound spermidine synthase
MSTVLAEPASPRLRASDLAGVACISATLLMTELALTRIFSVVMYYHFAFLAISIALFGLSASGVFAYVFRRRLDRLSTAALLSQQSLLYAIATIVALFMLVRLRVGLNYSRHNLILMLTIYALATLPFFMGGMVITLAISRMSDRINAVYAADLTGAAAGCLALIPFLDRLGAPGVVFAAAFFGIVAAVLFASAAKRRAIAVAGVAILAGAGVIGATAGFDVAATKGHEGDRILFSKWNSFSRIGVYERRHGDWSLSDTYHGPLPDTRFMDIDSAASTPILHVSPDFSNVQYLRYELTTLAYQLKEVPGSAVPGSAVPGSGVPGSAVPGSAVPGSAVPGSAVPGSAVPGFTALVIGTGGGRDLVSALVFGASHVDGVEINPIIADDVMRGSFKDYSGGIYSHPKVRIAVDDGRSFVKRAPDHYDVIQASLVDTWAATAAGAYTLTENSLYTVEAFNDYIDHLTDNGMLTITRWVFDGLRLVSLAQAAGEARGWDLRTHIAIVQQDQVATFLLKKSPFTPEEIAHLHEVASRLEFRVLYAPPLNGVANVAPSDQEVAGTSTGDYARLVETKDREAFYANYQEDISPTTDDRPFFFHTTKLEDQFQVAFGRKMLFGNGLSALMTLMGISVALVVLFVVGPLILAGGDRPRSWPAWLVYFGALGAGFMLIEVSLLQRFVLLLGHPVYSLTVTLFSLLLGTGIGAAWSRGFAEATLKRTLLVSLGAVALLGVVSIVLVTPLIQWAIPFTRSVRIMVAVAVLVPVGMVLGLPMPSGIRLLRARAPQMVTWAWGINGALSVLGATVAIFIAMNWGFGVTLLTASATYLVGFVALLAL